MTDRGRGVGGNVYAEGGGSVGIRTARRALLRELPGDLLVVANLEIGHVAAGAGREGLEIGLLRTREFHPGFAIEPGVALFEARDGLLDELRDLEVLALRSVVASGRDAVRQRRRLRRRAGRR